MFTSFLQSRMLKAVAIALFLFLALHQLSYGDPHEIPDAELRMEEYYWTYGCTPTAASMVLSYWDNDWYGRLIDYYYTNQCSGYDVPNTIDELRSSMGTDYDTSTCTGEGKTSAGNIESGMRDVTNNKKGYCFTGNQCWDCDNWWNPACWGTDWCWNYMKTEIDAGRPFVWTTGPALLSDDGHSVAAWGYRDDKYIILYNTWWPGREDWKYDYYLNNSNDHIAWVYMDGLTPGCGDLGQAISLDDPNGDETLLANNPYTIWWYQWGTAIEYVKLYYSVDGGVNWTPIAYWLPSVEGWNSYTWLVPNITSTTARVGMSAYTGAPQFIAGDGSFGNNTISMPTCSALTYPTDKWQRVWYEQSTGYCVGDGPDEANIEFDNNWGTGTIAHGRSDNIQFSSSRKINFSGGNYRIVIGSDDGVRLWIDGTLKIDKWFDRGYTTDTVDFSLSAGSHNLRLDYYENEGGARVSFAFVQFPDLIQTAVSNPPASATAASSFSVTDTVMNQGIASAGASITSYYLSLDAAKGSGDVLLTGSRSVPSLGFYGTNTGTITVTIPLNTASGSYYLLACADDTNLVVERNESNNCIASASKVNVSTVAPATPTPIPPAGPIATTTPTLSWNAVFNATEYNVEIWGKAATGWITTGSCGCGSGTGTCSYTVVTPLSVGGNSWRVQARNGAGTSAWSAWISFTIQIPLTAPTPVSPTQGSTITTATPPYSWTAVPAATWYYLSVNDPTGNRILQWFTASDAGCGAGIGNCAVTPTTTLSSGACNWRVQGWNSSSGYGPWSAVVNFTVNVPEPKATLISPNGTITTATPPYAWNPVPSSTWYRLSVDDTTGNRIFQWYTASDAGCGSGTGLCAVIPSTVLAAGAAKWKVQIWVNGAAGPWSNEMAFSVNIPEPKATLVSPTGTITTATPPYIWNAVPGSTWYRLSVDDVTGNRIFQWYTASAAGCGAGTGNCTVTPTTVLAAGAAKWKVQTWVSGAAGPWSNEMAFTVNVTQPPPPPAGPPGAATLVSPSGDIFDHTPTYTWNAVSNSTWYQLYVNDSTGNRIATWYTATQAGCSTGTGTCSVAPGIYLALGAGRWWIQTYNSYGYGPWSAPMNFTVRNIGF